MERSGVLMLVLFGIVVCVVLLYFSREFVEIITDRYRKDPQKGLKKTFEDLGKLNFEDETEIDHQLEKFYKRLRKINFVNDKCELCYTAMEYGKWSCTSRKECRKEEMLGELKEMIKQYLGGTKIKREDIAKFIKEIKK